MKKIYSIIAGILLTASVFAQAPQKMSYQAVIRNSSNALVTSTPVGMKISVLQASATGTVAYSETQTPSTNANGLVSLEIGTGTVITGTFATINWANGPYFIKTETDPSGGTSYSIISTSQFLSVPYALYAKTSEGIATKPEYLYCELNGLINGNTFMGLYFNTPMPPFNLYGSVVNGISYNASNGEITLKAGKTYQLEGSAKILSTTSTGTYGLTWFDKTNNAQFGNYSEMYGHNSTNDRTSQPVFSAIITPTTDIIVGIKNNGNLQTSYQLYQTYVRIVELR